ncbi:MAG: cysteine-rich CWC family protein [Sulfuritalea sp.]|nr:cysteine-rich CWC family protein [Sulfuritalea sp.]
MNSAPVATELANRCPQCGARFRCGMEGGDKECWCASLPALLPLPAKSDPASPAASCLCPACLKARLILAADR